jgi:hypothetical protein
MSESKPTYKYFWPVLACVETATGIAMVVAGWLMNMTLFWAGLVFLLFGVVGLCGVAWQKACSKDTAG